MMTKWWGLEILCPSCHKDAIIQSVRFSADGEILFIFGCFGCKQAIHYKTFACQLQHRALMNDIEADDKRKGKGIVTPPLAIAPPPTEERHLTSDDKAWEHAMGISPDDPEEGTNDKPPDERK